MINMLMKKLFFLLPSNRNRCEISHTQYPCACAHTGVACALLCHTLSHHQREWKTFSVALRDIFTLLIWVSVLPRPPLL